MRRGCRSSNQHTAGGGVVARQRCGYVSSSRVYARFCWCPALRPSVWRLTCAERDSLLLLMLPSCKISPRRVHVTAAVAVPSRCVPFACRASLACRLYVTCSLFAGCIASSLPAFLPHSSASSRQLLRHLGASRRFVASCLFSRYRFHLGVLAVLVPARTCFQRRVCPRLRDSPSRPARGASSRVSSVSCSVARSWAHVFQQRPSCRCLSRCFALLRAAYSATSSRHALVTAPGELVSCSSASILTGC